MPMKRSCLYLFSAAGVLLLGVSGYAQTTITSVPFTISAPGKYVLVQDISLNRGAVAITVTASNVTIDLGGYTLSAGNVPNQHTGISASGVSNLVIQNGSISQFQGGGGISISGGSGPLLTSVEVDSFGNSGVTLQNCTNSVISSCQVTKNFLTRSSASWGIGFFACQGVQVVKDSVSSYLSGGGGGAVGKGISSDGTNYFADDYISSCIVGISMSSTDKYRTITTSNCITGIVGGIDVDDRSN